MPLIPLVCPGGAAMPSTYYCIQALLVTSLDLNSTGTITHYYNNVILWQSNVTRCRNNSGDIIVIFAKLTMTAIKVTAFNKQACWDKDGCIKSVLKIWWYKGGLIIMIVFE